MRIDIYSVLAQWGLSIETTGTDLCDRGGSWGEGRASDPPCAFHTGGDIAPGPGKGIRGDRRLKKEPLGTTTIEISAPSFFLANDRRVLDNKGSEFCKLVHNLGLRIHQDAKIFEFLSCIHSDSSILVCHSSFPPCMLWAQIQGHWWDRWPLNHWFV